MYQAKTEKQRTVLKYAEALRHDTKALKDVLSEDWTSFAPLPGQEQGLDNFIEFSAKMASIPDWDWEIEDMIEEGNRVAVRAVFSGTNNFHILGEPNGKPFRIKAFEIHYFDDEGKICQTWHLEDWLHFIDQMNLKIA